ncbi:tyrosine-type recombinase/integrase [Sphingobacterium mizutaii]|uniref:tyrosine-type recombinase/integrase n=1 Tax=Sphingobacterium mizutaii TaxID=1010 RepID=UPI001627C6B8|nr:tyrosine-type recombinase/integrase [Sphingobacterium mizutaii]
MYIEVKAINTSDLGKRGYIIFYYGGKRYRFYNGKHLNIDLQPNRQVTQKSKSASLELIKFKTTEALNNGWNPEDGVYNPDGIVKSSDALEDVIASILNTKLTSSLSTSYKNDMKYLLNHFMNFLSTAEKQSTIEKLNNNRLVEFLNNFNSSATNYNNKRRMLSVIFNEIVERGYLLKNPLKATKKQKQKITLHAIYTDDEFKTLLDYLKAYNDDLYVMALIVYGCLLRPHTEVLGLKKKHFNSDFTKIVLSGDENKSGRVRIVNVPLYVKDAIKDRVEYMKDDNTNLFSLTHKKYNVGYFNTLWDRCKKDMLDKGIIKENQTIYSIRHTSATKIYMKCKDVSIVQKMMGHSNMTVTLTYLRSLGQMNVESLIEYIPSI